MKKAVKEEYRGYEPNNGSSCPECDKSYNIHNPYDWGADDQNYEKYEDEILITIKSLGAILVFLVVFFWILFSGIIGE